MCQINRLVLLSTIALLFFLLTVSSALRVQPGPLHPAFAHNDYWHRRLLPGALESGYSNVDADLFYRKGRLVVAHWFPFLKRRGGSIGSLYLKPISNTDQLTRLRNFLLSLQRSYSDADLPTQN